MMDSPSRSYRGRSASDRIADRRTRLLHAAADIWGEHGWAAVTMRGVCARAGLTNRYFYENFPDRDALLAAVWDQSLGDVLDLVQQAVAHAEPTPHDQLRAAVSAFVHAMAADPRKARIGFGDHTGSPMLEQRHREAMRTYTALMIDQAHRVSGISPDDPLLRVATMIAVGGLTEVITNWLNSSLTLTAEQLIDHTTTVLNAATAPMYGSAPAHAPFGHYPSR